MMAIDRRSGRGNMAMAALFAVFLIVGAPFVGQFRTAVRSALPAYFAAIIGGLVAVALGGAILTAAITVARIRERRAFRCLTLVAAVAVGAAFARLLRTGNADVDVVETFHFVEYGFLTWLFYRAWRRVDDGSVFVLPILAGLFVGTLDEWFQWLIPARVGEMRDVFLDGAAVACGLLFSIGFQPPERFTFALRRGSAMRVGWAVALVTVVFAAFLHAVHLGYEIRDPEIGSFLSRYTASELAAAALDRSQRWRDKPPLAFRRISREDQYMSEALWHVQRRNQASAAGDAFGAWRENLIVETFFAPVLDTPSYVSRAGHRWSPEQRAAAERRMAADSRSGVVSGSLRSISDAAPYPILVWPKSTYWIAVALLTAVLLLLSAWAERRQLAPEQLSDGRRGRRVLGHRV